RDGEVQYDFVEVMICPGGCIGGGGQPIVKGKEAFQAVRQARIKGLYGMIRGDKPRLAHENPDVQRAYSEFLSKDGSDLSSRLLHTNAYVDRSGDLQGKS
ncbi:MAG: iron hydrogenase small subunit, partial [Thermoguttaceae bacterium]|nr:iron hydrogenase small subunit [Thermoguttaceae bacterium]